MTPQQDLLAYIILGTATQSHFESAFDTYDRLTNFLDTNADLLESFSINTREELDLTAYYITDIGSRFEYTITRDINIVPLPHDNTYTVERWPEL